MAILKKLLLPIVSLAITFTFAEVARRRLPGMKNSWRLLAGDTFLPPGGDALWCKYTHRHAETENLGRV